MPLFPLQWRMVRFVILVGLLSARIVAAADEPALTKDQMKQFLLTAKVIKSGPAHKGITNTLRLTLTDGTITHDAHFQPVDEHAATKEMASGRMEMNFVDSYKYNIAAYELSRLLGLDHMMPVTVFRKWSGKSGAFAWWLPVKMDEGERLRKKLQPPDAEEWNKQMDRMRVFSELVYDIDRNLGNVLIGEDWKIYMIDFTRAFRLRPDLRNAGNVLRCDRQLLDKLKQLDAKDLAAKTKGYLTGAEIKALMQRRDKLLARIDQLIKEKSETAVLY